MVTQKHYPVCHCFGHTYPTSGMTQSRSHSESERVGGSNSQHLPLLVMSTAVIPFNDPLKHLECHGGGVCHPVARLHATSSSVTDWWIWGSWPLVSSAKVRWTNLMPGPDQLYHFLNSGELLSKYPLDKASCSVNFNALHSLRLKSVGFPSISQVGSCPCSLVTSNIPVF